MIDQTYKFYIGVDVAKAKLDVAISRGNVMTQTSNDEQGLLNLIKQLPPKKSSLIVFEASGGYENFAVHYLRSKKFNVAVVNAKRVRDFAKASGKLAKTDAIDAQMIMAYGKTFNPNPQIATTPAEKERTDRVTRRNQVVKMITLEKQHLEKAPLHLHTSITKHIQFLTNVINELK